MSIRLILDTSALTAYIAGDTRALHIGELIAIVHEGGNNVAAPALCVLAAHQATTDTEQRRELLDFVADAGDVLLLPLLADDVPDVAELSDTLHPDQRAHAAHAAITYGALLATYDRAHYTRELPADDILDL